MKKNSFLKILLFPLKCVEFIVFGTLLLVVFVLVQPFVWSFTRGKKNLQKNDEARVFVMNHYEIYGPIVAFLRFPYRFRPWVIDKMCDGKTIEQQMSIGLYNNYKFVPKFIKVIFVKIAKRFVLFIIKFANPIPVSRDNPRANIRTMRESLEVLNKKTSIAIFPEINSVKEGVGEFMEGFEFLGKYYYQKTGKKISFYPVFISRKRKAMYIKKPIVYNPDNEPLDEKRRIIDGVRNAMVNSYEQHEKSRKKSS